MEPFTRLRAVALPIVQANCDTDQIVPARYLQKPRAEHFGEFLFRDLRYRRDGTEDPQFVLNHPAYRKARILVAEENFGCGSSREHAVWALYDYGMRAVIAVSMGDIFTSNAAKNGLLTLHLPTAAVATLLRKVVAAPGLELTVDLEAQTVVAGGDSFAFDIDAYRKRCLINGLDELDYTLSQLERIKAFERDYGA